LREERRLRVFESRVLGEYLGLSGRESEENYITRSFMIHTPHQTHG